MQAIDLVECAKFPLGRECQQHEAAREGRISSLLDEFERCAEIGKAAPVGVDQFARARGKVRLGQVDVLNLHMDRRAIGRFEHGLAQIMVKPVGEPVPHVFASLGVKGRRDANPLRDPFD